MFFYRVTICTTNCKYEVVRQIAMKLGMMDVGEDDSWNICWTDVSVSIERVKEMKRFQVTVIIFCGVIFPSFIILL
jgi:tubulin polyglutamylase TTLL6/13